PLSQQQLDQICSEAKRYAFCFGIPDEAHPQNWQEIEDYVASMSTSDVMGRSEGGMHVRNFLEQSIPWPLRKPIWTFLCVGLPNPLQVMLDQPQANEKNLKTASRVQSILITVN